MITYISIPFVLSDGAARSVAIHCLISKNVENAFKNSSSMGISNKRQRTLNLKCLRVSTIEQFNNDNPWIIMIMIVKIIITIIVIIIILII